MKLYACDRCDKLVVEDEIHFVKIETDFFQTELKRYVREDL